MKCLNLYDLGSLISCILVEMVSNSDAKWSDFDRLQITKYVIDLVSTIYIEGSLKSSATKNRYIIQII